MSGYFSALQFFGYCCFFVVFVTNILLISKIQCHVTWLFVTALSSLSSFKNTQFLYSNIAFLFFLYFIAIRAKVAKYRKATNRTMYYAHVIKTYKTTHELPYEVLIRVPGQLCPCPPLEVGVEYLMVGSIKITYTGKQRLTLSINSFVKKWEDRLDQTIDFIKGKCGLPVAEIPVTTINPITEGIYIYIYDLQKQIQDSKYDGNLFVITFFYAFIIY